MTPNDREFGELIGEVKALGKAISAMQARNSDDHATVLAELGRLGSKLDGKVNWKWMTEQNLPDRVDSLESTRDKGTGKWDLLKGAVGAGIALLGILAGNGGHL